MQVGVIGAGVQARAAHLPAYRRIRGVEVSAIADIDEKLAKSAAKRFRIPRVYADYKALLEEPEIELVSICTPPHLHKEMAIECLKSGKHVLVEKPMATSRGEAEEIIQAEKMSGVKLCVVHNYRFFPAVLEAKRRIEEGRLGELISIHAHGHLIQSFDRPWFLREGGLGVLEDFGPHLIDIVLYLTGFEDVKKVFALGGNFHGHLNILMQVNLLFELESGVVAMLELSWAAGAKEVALYVQGAGGLLHLDVRNNHLREIHQYSTPVDDVSSMVGRLWSIGRGALNGSYFLGAKTYYTQLIKGFVESIERDTQPPVTAWEAMKTAVVIDAAYRSITEGRPVSLRGG